MATLLQLGVFDFEIFQFRFLGSKTGSDVTPLTNLFVTSTLCLFLFLFLVYNISVSSSGSILTSNLRPSNIRPIKANINTVDNDDPFTTFETIG